LCVLNRQPTWAKITLTVHGKGQRAESKDQRADMSTDVLCVLTDTHGHTWTATDVLCVLTDTQGHTWTATDVLCVLTDTHRRPMCAEGHPRTQGHTRTHTNSHGRPVCADGQPWTATDVLCVLADTHGRPLCTEQTAHVGQNHPNNSPRGPKSPKQSPGRASVLSPRTNVLICVLMDSHGRPVCADGHTRTDTNTHGQPRMSYSHRQPRTSCVCWRTPTDVLPRGPKSPKQSTGRASVLSPRTNVLICTHTDVLCVLTDTHRRPVCADGHPRTSFPQTSCVCWRTPTDVLCVLNRQPTWAKMTQTVHGKGQRAESNDQPTDVLCVLTDTHGCPVTNVLICVLMDSHGRPVCADGQTRTHTDSHGRPVCAVGQPRTSTDVLCVLADNHGRPLCTEQTAHVGQNHPNGPQEGPGC
ncbi:unnamed protein product, partial [Brassica rapa]